jgi:hypothetical protein
MRVTVGRTRKAGERFPSGKLKPTAEPMSGALWQRIKRDGVRLGLDPRLNTELGRLNWFGELTIAQTAAGHRIAAIYGRYESFRKLRRSVASPSYMTASGDAGMAEELLGEVGLAELEKKIRDATTAFQSLHREIPARLRSHVETLCVEDRPVSPALYLDLRAMLQRLAIAWKITGGARAAQANDARGPSRSGPPLHFNRHEGEGERQVPGRAASPAPKPSIDRSFWIVVAKKLRPDLSEEQLGEAYELQQALKQREIFRLAKAVRRGNVVPMVG